MSNIEGFFIGSDLIKVTPRPNLEDEGIRNRSVVARAERRTRESR